MNKMINVKALEEYMSVNNITLPNLAEQLNVDYSHLYRVIKGEKNGGSKIVRGIFEFCSRNGLDFRQFLFLPESLSKDNELSATKDSA